MSDPRLKTAMEQIKAVLREHDIAGIVVLNSETSTEYLVHLETSWTAIRIEDGERGVGIQFRCTKADIPDDARRKELCRATIGTLAGSIDTMNHIQEGLNYLLAEAGKKIEFSHISRRE